MPASTHADLLNALSDMQKSPAYAVRRGILRQAELTIAEQEEVIKAQDLCINAAERAVESGKTVIGLMKTQISLLNAQIVEKDKKIKKLEVASN